MIHWLKKWSPSLSPWPSSPLAAAATTTRAPGTLAAEADRRAASAPWWRPPTRPGLVPALSASTSSLTVFAPTDAAFTALATTLGFASATRDGDRARRPDAGQDPAVPRAAGAKTAADLVAGGATRRRRSTTSRAHATTLALNTTAGVKITDEVLNRGHA